MADKTLRICAMGHRYYKSTGCETCPVCERQKIPTNGFISELSAPAFRVLVNAGVDSVEKFAQHTEKEILSLHGIGKASLPKLRTALLTAGLLFKNG